MLFFLIFAVSAWADVILLRICFLSIIFQISWVWFFCWLFLSANLWFFFSWLPFQHIVCSCNHTLQQTDSIVVSVTHCEVNNYLTLFSIHFSFYSWVSCFQGAFDFGRKTYVFFTCLPCVMLGSPWDRKKEETHLSMLMAHRLRMLAVHIMTSRVSRMSQWIRLKRHSPTTFRNTKID